MTTPLPLPLPSSVTIAYEAWTALGDSQSTSQRQLTPLWNQPQANNNESGYSQNIDLAFLECRCNFKLALMYLKVSCPPPYPCHPLGQLHILNSGNLQFHCWIMSQYPHLVSDFLMFDNNNPIEPIKLLGAVTNIDNFDLATHCQLIAALIRCGI